MISFLNSLFKGKNDILFLKTIFSNINNNEINEISNLKDKLFIDYLKNYDKCIMIEGARKFIEKNKNRQMGIVTSCNKKVAEFILEKTKLKEYIQFSDSI